jgi:hypothetical protein
MSPHSPVEDQELLYRAVPDNPDFIRNDGGKVRISSTAFNDPKMEPSVDRANLCEYKPKYTRRGDGGVLSLIAKDIRDIPPTTHGKTGKDFTADIKPDPLPGNSAHALIFVHPDECTPGVFDRIKKALSRIARIELYPVSLQEID